MVALKAVLVERGREGVLVVEGEEAFHVVRTGEGAEEIGREEEEGDEEEEEVVWVEDAW